MARGWLLLALPPGRKARPEGQGCLRRVIQVNGWMVPARVVCSFRPWPVSSHLALSQRPSGAGCGVEVQRGRVARTQAWAAIWAASQGLPSGGV
jgi:hypothetical protein